MSFFKKPSASPQPPATPEMPEVPVNTPAQTPEERPHVVSLGTDDPVWDKDIKAARTRSKYRLLGALLLVLLALIFLPLMINTKREQVLVLVQSPGQPSVKVLGQNMRDDGDMSADDSLSLAEGDTSTPLASSAQTEHPEHPIVPESIAQKTASLNNTGHGAAHTSGSSASSGSAGASSSSLAKASHKTLPPDYNTVGEAIYAAPAHGSSSSASTSRAGSTSSASGSTSASAKNRHAKTKSSASTHRPSQHTAKKRSDDGRYALSLLGGNSPAQAKGTSAKKSAKTSPYTYHVAFPRVSSRKAAERTLAALTLKGVRTARIDQFRYHGRTYYRTVITGFDSMASALQMQQKTKRWHLPASVVIKAKR